METQQHWRGVYDQKASTDVSWYQDVPTVSLTWILEVVPRGADPRIVDVGAGASTLVDHLIDYGYHHLAVLDIAPSALDAVRERLGERAREVEWVTGDLLEFDPVEAFDLWHDRAVLHFLREPDQQKRYVEVLRSALKPGGYAVIATFAVGGPTRCSGLEIVQYDGPRIRTLLGAEFSLLREEQEVHRTPSGSDQLFSYFLLQRNQDGYEAARRDRSRLL